MGCGEKKLSKYLTQTFMAHCNEMRCQQVTLSGYAEWPKVADAVIEAPARLALHRQFAVGRDVINKLRHHLLEVEHDLVVVNGLHALFDFPGHLLYGVCLRHPHHIPPEARSSRYGLRLGDEGDRVAHISGGKLSPMLVEFDALA